MEHPSKSNAPPSLVGEFHLNEMIARAEATPPGCFVEVGVYKGGSAWRLWQVTQAQGRMLYLYDTFEGIPHQAPIDSHSVGDFKDVEYREVYDLFAGAVVVRGIFPASAIDMPPIAFAHLDCDQYQSVLESAIYLQSRMVSGGVMWFDDSPCLAGAHRAVREIFANRVHLSSDHGKHYVVF